MSRFISLTLIIAAAVVVMSTRTIAAPDCHNPIFINATTNASLVLGILNNTALTFAAAPIASSGVDKVCSNIGDTTCCNSTTHDQIKAHWNRYDQVYAIHAALIPNLNNPLWYLAQLNISSDQWNALCAQHPGLAELAQNTANNIQGIANETFECAGGMAGYFEGMTCLACDPNYTTYMDVTVAPPTLRLQQETCDNVYDRCQFAYTIAPRQVIQILQNALVVCAYVDPVTNTTFCDSTTVAIITQVLSAVQQYVSIMCVSTGANCQAEFCGIAFRGMDYPLDDVPPPSFLSVISDTFRQSRTNRRIAGALTVAFSAMQSAFKEQSSRLQSTRAWSMQPPLSQEMVPTGPGFANVTFLPTSSANALASYSVGCASLFSTTACPAPPPPADSSTGTFPVPVSSSSASSVLSSSSSAGNAPEETSIVSIIILAVVVLAVVAVIGLLCYMYRASICRSTAADKPLLDGPDEHLIGSNEEQTGAGFNRM